MSINRWRILQVLACVATGGALVKIGAPWEAFAGVIAVAVASYEAGRRIEPIVPRKPEADEAS